MPTQRCGKPRPTPLCGEADLRHFLPRRSLLDIRFRVRRLAPSLAVIDEDFSDLTSRRNRLGLQLGFEDANRH